MKINKHKKQPESNILLHLIAIMAIVFCFMVANVPPIVSMEIYWKLRFRSKTKSTHQSPVTKTNNKNRQ